MHINIAATKTNLLQIKKTLALTEEGHELLDEKRRILLNQLAGIIHIVDKMQRDLDLAFKEAYDALDRATVVMGRAKLEALSFSVNINTHLSISRRQVLGVNMPVVDLVVRENPPYYSPVGVSFYVDEAGFKFKELLKHLAKLAERKIALLNVAREVSKTIRKLNALEKIHLPFYRQTLKYISERLDEENRDSFSMLKIIKRDIEAKALH
jgi:V/A-type H+-transporting ATPase subunit D